MTSMYDLSLYAYTCEKMLGNIPTSCLLVILRDNLRIPVWKPLTLGSGRLYFHWMTLTRCPCWQASALLKCSRARPWIHVSCRGAALSLTPTSELPGLVEKRWKNFPAGINKIISLKHCNTFLAWVVLVGITHLGFSRPELVTIYSISLCICCNEPRAVQETSMEEKQEEAPPGWYVNYMSFWKVSCLYLGDLCCRSSRICDTVHCYSIVYNVRPSTTSCLHGFK